MKHDIKHPANWPPLDDLHTYLWKRFPMDRFEFVESSEHPVPEYAGTNLSSLPVFSVFSGAREMSFFEEVKQAVQDFVSDRKAAA